MAAIEYVIALIGDAPELMDVDRHQTTVMEQAQVVLNQFGWGVLRAQAGLDFFDITITGAER
jgi:hypothetical protein